MPVPTSQAQFRFLQAVAHGVSKARKRGKKGKGLSAASAKAGLNEFKAEGKGYGSLPARKGAAK